MNIEKRIKAAWKKHCKTDEEYLGLLNNGKREYFEKGYHAALRDLYVDLDLNMSECVEYEWYWIFAEDVWRLAMRVDFGFEVVNDVGDDVVFECVHGDVRRVLDVNIPSLDEIFGGAE